MRLWAGLLTLIGIGVVSMVLADPAAPAPDAAASAPSAAAPAAAPAGATPVAPAAVPTAAVITAPAEDDLLDRHLRAEGYKVEMRNGQKVYCRKEEVIGTRLGASTKTCNTAEQLKITEAQAHEELQRSQRQQTSGPSGR
jgi:hypothetical protein